MDKSPIITDPIITNHVNRPSTMEKCLRSHIEDNIETLKDNTIAQAWIYFYQITEQNPEFLKISRKIYDLWGTYEGTKYISDLMLDTTYDVNIDYDDYNRENHTGFSMRTVGAFIKLQDIHEDYMMLVKRYNQLHLESKPDSLINLEYAAGSYKKGTLKNKEGDYFDIMMNGLTALKTPNAVNNEMHIWEYTH